MLDGMAGQMCAGSECPVPGSGLTAGPDAGLVYNAQQVQCWMSLLMLKEMFSRVPVHAPPRAEKIVPVTAHLRTYLGGLHLAQCFVSGLFGMVCA